jgi:DNA-binding NarL/FixJ family response regulator
MPFTSGPRLRVLLVDDHVLVREGLRALLERVGLLVVGEASDGRAAVAVAETTEPDVVVLDISIPLLNGVDAAREIIRRRPETKVILLTMYSEEWYVLAALQAGVRGYVLKSNAASNLVHAIDAVRKGETYLSPGVSQTVVEAYLSNRPASADPLTAREREVLQLIAEGKNMRDIGRLLGISPRTAETHRARIMNKLDIHDVAGLVRYAIDRGLTRATFPRSGVSDQQDLGTTV